MKGIMGFAARLLVFFAFILLMGMTYTFLIFSDGMKLLMFAIIFIIAVWVFAGYEKSD